jgi:hypothetical protein
MNMTVSVIWSLTNGAAAIGSTVDHGMYSSSSYTTPLELFIRHNGTNSITDAGLYIREFSGTYSGGFTASSDLAELIEWGDSVAELSFGGFHNNFLATTSYPNSGWPTYDDKEPTGGFVHYTGVGDSAGNAVLLPTSTGATAEGEIQAGSSPNVRFKVRIQVPSTETTLGIRQWDQVLTYTYTS